MNRLISLILLCAASVLAAGCSGGDNKHEFGYVEPSVGTYEIDIVAVEVVNRDSGVSVAVEGVPAEGGMLVVDWTPTGVQE